MEANELKPMMRASGVAFVRNSDVRYDTRLRKAISAATTAKKLPGLTFFGWIRDGRPAPNTSLIINKKEVCVNYFTLPAKFGKGFWNILRLALFNLWLFKAMIANRKSFSIIYVCDFDVAIPSLLIRLIFGKKIIYDIFDFYSHTHAMPRLIRYFVEKCEYLVCKSVDAVVVCTDKRAQTIREKCSLEPVVIYNTPNLDKVIINNGFEDERIKDVFRIVYVGTLSPTGRLLREITELLKNRDDIEFHVAGSGPLENYFSTMSVHYKNILFYGQVSNDDALMLQMRSDLIFATYDPSLEINRNSAPNKVYEAMALRKPIVVCKRTDADSEVVENNCGFAIDYSADEFINIVDLYISEPQLKVMHGNNGLLLYERRFRWEICERRLVETLNDLS